MMPLRGSGPTAPPGPRRGRQHFSIEIGARADVGTGGLAGGLITYSLTGSNCVMIRAVIRPEGFGSVTIGHALEP